MLRKYDLSGEWLFSFDRAKYDDKITLPSTTAMSHKGEVNNVPSYGYLTEMYPFSGDAYYKRTVSIRRNSLSESFYIFLERSRTTTLYIDGVRVGEFSSFFAPHCYDITDYIRWDGDCAEVTVEVVVNNRDYMTPGGHMTSPDTQTNWNGILGRMEMQVYGTVKMLSPKIKSCFNNKTLTIDFDVCNPLNDFDAAMQLECSITRIEGFIKNNVKNYDVLTEHPVLTKHNFSLKPQSLHINPGTCSYSLTYDFSGEDILWSEHSPYHMKLSLELAGNECFDRIEFCGGIREFCADTHDFLINKIPTKLRGKHDGLIFPLTGAAPMDVYDYLRVMGTAVRYGINHYRYHTCCPPDAAFEAADLLGIYMEPELPFWGTIQGVGEEGCNEAEQNFLIEEGMRILDCFGNHPSMCMMSMGNELWGNRERIGDIIDILKKHDDRVLYTQSSNGFQFVPKELPNEDFFVGARLAGPVDGHNDRLIRGSFATCDAPLGVIQTEAPSTAYNFDAAILGHQAGAKAQSSDITIQYGTGVKTVKADDSMSGVDAVLPIVSHEICQYFFYPDYKLLSKYTGVLKPFNIEAFRDALDDAGLLRYAGDYATCSGHFSTACYKEELEMMHRSRYMAGYQILDIQDFTGQGTALVGVLDSFMESKGLIAEEDWRSFCSDDVLMAAFKRYVYTTRDTFNAEIMLSHFNPLLNLSGRSVEYSFCEHDKPLCAGSLTIPDIGVGTHTVGRISTAWSSLDQSQNSHKITLTISITETGIRNQYTLWVYRDYSDEVIAEALDGLAIDFIEPEKYIPGFYCTDFWNYTMFKQISESMGKEVAVGTLGLMINKCDPALKGFECEAFSTPQWYNLITGSRLAVLDDENMSGYYEPIVQMIDNPWRNHTLGLIYRYKGRLTTTIPKDVLTSCPEGRSLIMSMSGR